MMQVIQNRGSIIIIASCFLIRKTMIVASGKLYQPPLAFELKTPDYYHTIKNGGFVIKMLGFCQLLKNIVIKPHVILLIT